MALNIAKLPELANDPLNPMNRLVPTAAHTRLSLTGRISSTKADRKHDHNSNNQIHIRQPRRS